MVPDDQRSKGREGGSGPKRAGSLPIFRGLVVVNVRAGNRSRSSIPTAADIPPSYINQSIRPALRGQLRQLTARASLCTAHQSPARFSGVHRISIPGLNIPAQGWHEALSPQRLAVGLLAF